MRDIFELLDAVDLALGRASDAIDETAMVALASRAQSLRSKRAYVGDVLVLAIAGGTGTGKSSVLNALAGTEISSVSVLRPHTDHPVAWIPSHADAALRGALGQLGITRQVEQDVFPQLAIVDLPDMDSIAAWHRQIVEDLLPRIDAVLWLFEPEKYRDSVVHDEFLTELAPYRHQFFFALNQIDRLREADLKPVLDDLEAALVEDGFDAPLLFAIAAAPPDGPEQGLAELREFLSDQLDVKRTAIAKTIIDARTLVRDIAETAGVWNADSLDFDARWLRAKTLTTKELLPPVGPAAREEAICRLEDLIAALSTEVGNSYGAALRHRFGRSVVESTIDRGIQAVVDDGPDAVGSVLDTMVGSALRSMLWHRARMAATLVYAAIGADQLADRVGQLARRGWVGTRTFSARRS